MTPEEHRKLDAEVAEKVMGIEHDFENCHWCQSKDPYARGNPHIDHYSTDIKAAWRVVEKQWEDRRRKLCLWRGYSGDWFARFDNPASMDYGSKVSAETAPEAICRAALEAVK